MTDHQAHGPQPRTVPSAPDGAGPAGLPPDAGGLAVCGAASHQALAQPDPMRAADSNTSVAGEEDPGAALDAAAFGAVQTPTP